MDKYLFFSFLIQENILCTSYFSDNSFYSIWFSKFYCEIKKSVERKVFKTQIKNKKIIVNV